MDNNAGSLGSVPGEDECCGKTKVHLAHGLWVLQYYAGFTNKVSAITIQSVLDRLRAQRQCWRETNPHVMRKLLLSDAPAIHHQMSPCYETGFV